MKTLSRLTAAWLFLTLALTPSWAVDLRDVLTDYTPTNFGRKDGISGPVQAMAQDADGFLWIGTDDGLVRFDGVRFRPWESLSTSVLPKLTVRALLVDADASLWVGFGATGGIARISGRTVTLFGAADHAVTGPVVGFDRDASGAIWAAGGNGLFRYADRRWQQFGAEVGLPNAPVLAVDVDGDTLWAATSAGVFKRIGNDSRFEQVEPAAGSPPSAGLSLGPDGRMWISDTVVGFRPVGSPRGRTIPPASQSDPPSGRGVRLIHDRRGDLWVATIGQGLWRVRLSEPTRGPFIERSTVLSGLSSDAVRSVYEDRDGNIWAGTTDGLDRFVPHRITPWAGLGIVGSVATTTDGHLWAATEDELLRFSKVGDTWRIDPQHLRVPAPRIIRADARSGLWAVSVEDVVRVDGTTVTRVPLPPRFPVSWIESIAADRAGGLWAAALGGVLLHDIGGRFQIVDQVAALKDARVTTALTDHRGRLWLAYGADHVGVWSSKGVFHSYGPEDGLGPGPYNSMIEDTNGRIWVGGAGSLNRFDGTNFSHVTRTNGVPVSGILSLVEAADHHLWLSTAVGIIRLAPAEFDAASRAPGTPMYFRLYDTSDGLAGFPVVVSTIDRNTARTPDGMLWFLTSRGLSMLDPVSLAATHRTPKVTIDEMRADDRLVSDRRLRPGTAKLEIAYTAPELTYSLKTRFRYRLDGWDENWVDAGTRRQVLYTNLPPREYTFRVSVSGDEGRWTDEVATVSFSIAPRFYQTFWFYPLAALVVGGLIAGAWRLRLRALRRQFSLVLGERVRLSRELHDTLLQSLVGVALEFDAVSKSLETSPQTAKARVVKIREHVEEYIREARRSIWSLRSNALETGDLVEALKESAERATSNHGVDLAFSVEGAPRRLPPQIEHQVLRIGQEAVLNAVRHAQANHLNVRVNYAPSELVLRLEDDGIGFDPRKTAEGTTDHYGIITMRERAQQAGGDVTITSAPGHGTIVEARVPTKAFAAQEAQAS